MKSITRRGEKVMESWRNVWRTGVAPLLSTESLEALRQALVHDDPRLLQGATTTPPPLQCVQDWPVEAACALGYCGWVGDGLETVAEVEECLARKSFDSWNAANRYATRFDEKRRVSGPRRGERIYRVEIERREPPVVRTLPPATSATTTAA